MQPTPFWSLVIRGLRARCPVCSRGPLYGGPFQVLPVCSLCGYRYSRQAEYGGGGYLSGAISLNIMITGAVPLILLVWLAASGRLPAIWLQFVVGLSWAALFPLLFHRVACALWLAIDLRLNPPAMHELAVAPPRPARSASDEPTRGQLE